MIIGWKELEKELKLKEQKKHLKNVIANWQMLVKKLDIKEKKKHLNNVIGSWNKLETKLNVKEQKNQLKTMIVAWNNIECKKKLLGTEKHPWKLKVEDLQMLLDSKQPRSICQQKIQVLEDLLMPIDSRKAR